MNRITPALERNLAHLGSILVLAILVLYSYADLYVVPDAGFFFNPSNGEIAGLHVDTDLLRIGDRLIQVGPVTMEMYNTDLRQTLFDGVELGDIVSIQVERAGERLTVPWEFPDQTSEIIVFQLIGTTLFGYLFWAAGLATVLLVRPIRARSRLLTAFFYVTAVWLTSGDISAWHVWQSAILQRMAIWLCVPIYLHLHWEFPQTLRPLPKGFWWGLYGLAGILAGLQWFQIPDKNAYLLGFLVAVGGSIGLLLLRLVIRPAERRDVFMLFSFSAVAFIPIMLFGLLGLTDEFPNLGRATLLALPLLPAGYFYAVFRRQIGGLENRINRALVLYLFGLTILTLTAAVLALATPLLSLPNPSLLVIELLAVGLAFFGLWLFPRFRSFVERRFLNIPLPPTHLVERYAARITSSLDRPALVQLLKGEILASLLVRESALYHLGTDGSAELIYAEGLAETDLPASQALAALTLDPNSPGWKTEPLKSPLANSWARLALPLKLGGDLTGLWLLGRRDPDDEYTPAEISILETLANQTAVALQNILQKERLQSLFQANIDRHEEERARLARYLHDEVLNELVVLGMHADGEGNSRYDETYRNLSSRIRQTIQGLRPAMLNYGLGTGLQEMVDDLSERNGEGPEIQLDVPRSDARYPPRVEEHLFRITQQACENALQHARADFLRIEGQLAQGSVHLSIVDDGAGFEAGELLNLNQLLVDHHYGIAGMIERAALIGAEVRVDSTPGQGTRVQVAWEMEN